MCLRSSGLAGSPKSWPRRESLAVTESMTAEAAGMIADRMATLEEVVEQNADLKRLLEANEEVQRLLN